MVAKILFIGHIWEIKISYKVYEENYAEKYAKENDIPFEAI